LLVVVLLGFNSITRHLDLEVQVVLELVDLEQELVFL
jgi:hypothetical protein